MELALLITTPGFVHIFEEIINQMDTKTIFTCPLVCKSWWQVIQNHPKWWRCIIRRIRIKKALIHPDFRGIMQSVEAKKDIRNLGSVLKQFCEDKRTYTGEKFEDIQGMNMRDSGTNVNEIKLYSASCFAYKYRCHNILRNNFFRIFGPPPSPPR